MTPPVLRVAPCTCEYTIQAGVILDFRDCARHGGQGGDGEDLAWDHHFDAYIDARQDLPDPYDVEEPEAHEQSSTFEFYPEAA